MEYAFSLPEEKFQAKYGISKPSKNTTFITSCKVGGRATKMRDKLNEMGYNMVKAYTGSMTEWIKMGGEDPSQKETMGPHQTWGEQPARNDNLEMIQEGTKNPAKGKVHTPMHTGHLPDSRNLQK